MANLTPAEVKDLFPSAASRIYPQGQIVIYQGDQPNHIMYVVSGALKYYDVDENGSEKILQIIGEHGFFSMVYAFGEGNEIGAFYSTLATTELLLIPLDEFLERLENDPALSLIILSWFASEVEYLMQRIKGLGKSEARSKLLEVLNYLALRHGVMRRGGWVRVKFPFSQQSMADLIGISRETVSSVFKDVEAQKIVRSPKHLIIEIHLERLQHCLD